MRESEWHDLVAYINGLWGHAPLTGITSGVGFTVLADVTIEDARRAIVEMSREGRDYPPTPGQIVRYVRERLNPTLTWEEAWRHIRYALRKMPFGDRVLAEIERTAGPIVAGWAYTYGITRLSQEPTDDPEIGGAVLARMGASYRDAMASGHSRRRLERVGLLKHTQRGLHRIEQHDLIDAVPDQEANTHGDIKEPATCDGTVRRLALGPG